MGIASVPEDMYWPGVCGLLDGTSRPVLLRSCGVCSQCHMQMCSALLRGSAATGSLLSRGTVLPQTPGVQALPVLTSWLQAFACVYCMLKNVLYT
jgi:hypothetical protein